MAYQISLTISMKTLFAAGILVATVSSSVLNNIIRADDSCAERCNVTGTVPGAPCQCNTACVRFDDCCPDYYSLCLGQTGSCAGRCDQQGTVPGTCQCNKPCVDFGDCCPDYADSCLPGDAISEKELEDLAELLLSLDTENNATQYIKVNQHGNPLLTVASLAYSRPTIEKLIALHDNYNPDTSVRESYTPEEEEEMDAFIDAIFNTRIMQAAQEFLVSKNLPNGREKFFEIWFELYTRGGNGVISSCGFEHVFVGELQDNQVLGFYNWERFAVEEANDRLQSMGYMDHIDFGESGSIIEHRFRWLNAEKRIISSMLIGSSPELELALYSICFHARPNAKCPTSLKGNKIQIQSYTTGSSGQYVATAYPDLST